MIKHGFEPDSIVISSVLASRLSIKLAAQIHVWVLRRGYEWNLSIVNAMVVVSHNFRLDRARWLFNHMPERDVVSWNSIISAHCKHLEAIVYFKQMETEHALPNSITFVSLLSTCAHLGMVNNGERLFSLMRDKYGITPIMEHYACMVNLYVRTGLINEAYDLIMNRMDFEAGPTVWELYCTLNTSMTMWTLEKKLQISFFDLVPDNEHNFNL